MSAFQYFGHHTGIVHLSNLHACHIIGLLPYSDQYLTFPSAQHYYVATTKCHNLTDAQRLTVNGDLAQYHSLKSFYSTDQANKKIAYWKQKQMIGIIAKLFAEQTESSESVSDDIWVNILLHKYSQNKSHLYQLLMTYDRILVDYDPFATKQTELSARVIEGQDVGNGVYQNGRLVGNNNMGKIMMGVRQQFAHPLITFWQQMPGLPNLAIVEVVYQLNKKCKRWKNHENKIYNSDTGRCVTYNTPKGVAIIDRIFKHKTNSTDSVQRLNNITDKLDQFSQVSILTDDGYCIAHLKKGTRCDQLATCRLRSGMPKQFCKLHTTQRQLSCR